MIYTFTINGQILTYNKYINACRTHWSKGARLKKETEKEIMWQIPISIRELKLSPVEIEFTWFAKNRATDFDNYVSSKKFIMDSLVKSGVIADDSQKHVKRIVESEIRIDKENPRVEIKIEVVKNEHRID